MPTDWVDPGQVPAGVWADLLEEAGEETADLRAWLAWDGLSAGNHGNYRPEAYRGGYGFDFGYDENRGDGRGAGGGMGCGNADGYEAGDGWGHMMDYSSGVGRGCGLNYGQEEGA